MTRQSIGVLSVSVCCVVGLATWYFFSMFEFYLGWMRLDPMCAAYRSTRYPIYVVDNLYTAEAAQKIENVVATTFGKDAVYVDLDGAVYIKPALYYGYLDELDRFPQLVVRPEDEPHLYQSPSITCSELQQLLRSPIDMTKSQVLGWPFSLYVLVTQPSWDTLQRWQTLYRY